MKTISNSAGHGHLDLGLELQHEYVCELRLVNLLKGDL